MITASELSDILTFLVVQIILWGVGCLGHYSDNQEQGVAGPRVVRRLFGDFRATGRLDPQGMVFQVICCLALLVVVLWAILNTMTPILLAKIGLVEFLIIGIVKNVIIRDIMGIGKHE